METSREIFKIKMALLVLADYMEDPAHHNYKIQEGIQEILEAEFSNKKTSSWKKLLTILKTAVFAEKS